MFYDESDLTEMVIPITKSLFNGLNVQLSTTKSSEADIRNAVVSDCTVIVTTANKEAVALANFEFKKDIAKTNSNPDIQNIGYFFDVNRPQCYWFL